MRLTRLVLLAAAALVLGHTAAAARPAAGVPAPKKAASVSPLDAALDARISGKASLDDVRVEASWSTDGRASITRLYGDGVALCDRRLQIHVSKDRVLAVLRALRRARIGAMPDRFGEGEEGEEDEKREAEEKHEGPRLKGRVSVRVGSLSKMVLQLIDGEQSAELEKLAAEILAVCHGAKAGVGADDLADGFRKLDAGSLAPQTFALNLQYRRKAAGTVPGEAWILEIEGRRVTDSLIPPSPSAPRSRRLVLSDADFQALTKGLAGDGIADLPINLYSADYTDLGVAILNRSRSISGRKFLNMTPETHGEKQKAFDRILEALRALHARVEEQGEEVPRTAAPAPKASEKERESEEERERERENRKKPTPAPGRG